MPEPTPQELEAVRLLSKLIDLVEYQSVVGRKSKFGKKPHAKDPWGYTKALFATYTEPRPLDEIVELFGRLGATNEIQAAKWVGLHMKYVP